MDLAVNHHQAGRLAQAEPLYRKVLSIDPNHPNALHLLGLLLAQAGDPAEGIRLMQQAADRYPNIALFHLNLGEACRRNLQNERAITHLRRAVELDPALVEAHNNLSIALLDHGDPPAAIAAAKAALARQPNFAEAHANLANALKKSGDNEAALAEYRRAIELNPAYADAYINMAAVLYQLERLNESIEACHMAMSLLPTSAQAHNNLGAALDALNRCDEAIEAYATAIRLDPKDPVAHANFAFAMARQGDLDRALDACKAAIDLKPDYADAWSYQAHVLCEKGLLGEAFESARKAVSLDPELAAAHNTMGNVLKDMGRIREAIDSYRHACHAAPEAPGYHSNLVYTLYFDPDCPPQTLLEEHLAWAHQHARPFESKIRPHTNNRDPNRRLKIGYVSPDFRAHPVGRFLLPLFQAHDHTNFEIFCYASVVRPDVFTPRLQACADVWRDVRSMTNTDLAEQIRRDQIDILIDLTMHMGANRLPLFAMKPAPVQVTYLAYAGTTGLSTIDYRLTDPYLDPPDMPQEFYTEKSFRLAHSYWCYQPTIENLAQTPLPAPSAGHVTFGCLNNFCKLNTATLTVWEKILRKVPDSRLMLHTGAGEHRQAVNRFFSAAGIDPQRIDFVEKLSLPRYMDQYHQMDIALDPFPYVGGTTTCDALWMGVPVVTLAGSTAISRGGVSILSNIGHPEWIADSPEQYVEIAAALASDLPRLAEIRKNLRDQLAHSPLTDASRFARDMESAYRQMWLAWCAGGSS
jgi:predicted O-linked N-acetylglucosamine transferase (SPINDLY family)